MKPARTHGIVTTRRLVVRLLRVVDPTEAEPQHSPGCGLSLPYLLPSASSRYFTGFRSSLSENSPLISKYAHARLSSFLLHCINATGVCAFFCGGTNHAIDATDPGEGSAEVNVPKRDMLFIRDNLVAAESARRRGDTAAVYKAYNRLAVR